MHREYMLKEIIEDRTSGSTDLALKVAELYSACGGCSSHFISTVRERVNEAHVGMGLVRNVNSSLYSSWHSRPDRIAAEAEKVKAKIKGQLTQSVNNSSEILQGDVAIATISHSSAVREALIRNREKIREVYVLESRPGLEGRSLAALLRDHGMDVVLVADAAVQEVSKRADLALCGSDAVLSDNSLVHKIGTYPLFFAFREEKKETFSMTVSMKFESRYDRHTYPGFSVGDPHELAPEGLKALNIYFDITPSTYVSGYVSERGISMLSA